MAFFRVNMTVTRLVRGLGLSLLVSAWVACATNPVTGQRQLNLVSEREEINIGQQHYGPTQQSQGGAYAVEPALSAYVNQVGQRLAAVSDRELPYEFVVLNNSVPNAWALPGGKIAVNRGLLIELNNEAELAAVLGHEIVHSAARHGAQAMERGMLMQGALVATAIAASDHQLGGLIVGGAQLGAQLVNTRYGREAERESDAYGIRYMVKAGYDPQAAVSLQETFVRLSEGRSPGWLEGLFSSHPPSMERVQNNRALVQQIRAEGFTGGDLGAERYQQNIAFLHQHKPAYDAFDEAMALAQNERFDEARARVDVAISLLPREARFHGLRGDLNHYQRNYREAIADYDRAIERDPSFFSYYLGRGMTYVRQGDRARGERDLQASVELLPTAVAMNELGNLALARNDRAAARQYFEVAGGGGGPAADTARASFARIDVTENPDRYLNIQPFVTDGRLGARVTNQSPAEMRAIQLDFRIALGGQQAARTVGVARLAPGQSVDVDSTIPLPPGTVPAANQVAVVLRSVQVQ
jgi:beta-barrel assembly-enhancing protease